MKKKRITYTDKKEEQINNEWEMKKKKKNKKTVWYKREITLRR